MTKHAINAFLATSVTFINELAALCERVGADAKEVERGLQDRAADRTARLPRRRAARSPAARWRAMSPFCARSAAAGDRPTPLMDGVLASNAAHRLWAQRRLERELGALAGAKVAIWGLTYKPGTDTLRRSSAVELCRWLVESEARACTCTIRRPGCCRTTCASTRHEDPLDAAAGAARARRRDRLAAATATIDVERLASRGAGPARARCQPVPRRRRSAADRAFSTGRGGTAAHEPAARGPQRRHHRRQPGSGPGHRRRLRRRRRERAAVRARRGAARRGHGSRWRRTAAPGQIGRRACAPTSRVRRTSARLADEAFAIFPQVHVLVNNAGVYGPMGPSEDVDWDGVGPGDGDQRLRLGAAVPRVRAALQAAPLRQDRPALRRRCDQSAAAHQRLRRVEGRDRPVRRDRSRSRSRPFGIDVNAIAPGALNTRMLDEVLAAGPGRRRAPTSTSAWSRRRRRAARRSNGARRWRSFSARPQSDGITGRLLSAVWDPWETLADPARRSRRQRRLHAAPHRAEGSRLRLGGPMNPARRRHRRLRPHRPQARGGARRRAARRLRRRGARAGARAGAHASGRDGRATDWRGRRRRPDVDIVIVATTNDALAPIAIAAVEAGKHVLVEKPAARTVAELDRADRRGARARPARAGRLQPSLSSGAAGRREPSSTPARSGR